MSNEARKAEAADVTKPAVVKFRDREFTLPRDYNDWPLELHEAMEDGAGNLALLRAAIGPEQWAVLRTMRLKTPDLVELDDLVAVAMGFKSVGESQPSSD